MKIWSDKRYYQKIAISEDFSHPGFKKTQVYCQNGKIILDVGCGDGSKLSKLGNSRSKRVGCEVSPLAKKLGFDQFDGINLPYPDNMFDRVVSFFVLEHTKSPADLLQDMIRVLNTQGLLILLAPNFGAPNRASPNYKRSRIFKLISGLIQDIFPGKSLNWHSVQPQIVTMDNFQRDMDTTIEPYLGSLVAYLKSLGLTIVEAQSFWEMELPNAKIWQRVFRLFKYWGPHLYVVAKKL